VSIIVFYLFIFILFVCLCLREREIFYMILIMKENNFLQKQCWNILSEFGVL
jgi:hypothetical protein